jgi:hypothetical protein
MRSRRGIALFAALSTMAVIALLVGGMVATSTLAQRSAALTHVDAELGAAADYALASAIDSSLANLPLGISQTRTMASGRTASTVSATRLPRDVLWLVAESRMTGGPAGRRRVNLVLRWPVPRAPTSPIVSRGHVRLGAQVVFAADSGGDADCRVASSVPSVLLAPGASLTSIDVVATRTDSSAADSATYVATAAQHLYLDSASRVLHVRGDTTIAAGTIDGILLIDGRLTITGTVTIRGLVIARNAIDARAARLALDGALLSYEAPITGQFAIDIGEAVIRHSPCVISRAWRRILPLRPVRARSWAEIF